MANDPNTTSIIAILIRMVQPPDPDAPPDGSEFGPAIKSHIVGSEIEASFGQQLTGRLLPAVQHDDPVGLLGVAPPDHDHGVF
jgi:hypothetical protein